MKKLFLVTIMLLFNLKSYSVLDYIPATEDNSLLEGSIPPVMDENGRAEVHVGDRILNGEVPILPEEAAQEVPGIFANILI